MLIDHCPLCGSSLTVYVRQLRTRTKIERIHCENCDAEVKMPKPKRAPYMPGMKAAYAACKRAGVTL